MVNKFKEYFSFLKYKKNFKEMNPIIVVSMPRSGSAFIRATIMKKMKIKINQQIDFGPLLFTSIDASKLYNSLDKKIYIKSHFPASEYNLGILKYFGIRKIVLQVRDPRDALISWHHQVLRDVIKNDPSTQAMLHSSKNVISPNHYELLTSQQINWLVKNYYPTLIKWLKEWINTANCNPNFKVLITHFPDVKNQPVKTINSILSFYGYPQNVELSDLPIKQKNSFKYNYRRGIEKEYLEILNTKEKEFTYNLLKCNEFKNFNWI